MTVAPERQQLSADEANDRFAAGQQAAYALEERLRRQYESSLLATARRCVAAYRAGTQVLTAAMPPKPEGDPQNLSQPPQPTVDEVVDGPLAAVSAEARTQATRRKAVAAVAGEILSGFGSIPEVKPLLEPLVKRQAGVQAERIVAGTRDAVANVLLDALVEGWSVDTTADYLGEVLREQARWRAEMLARTDLIALSNGAAQDAVLILGDQGPQFKTWLSAGDERVRESHQDANRQTVGLGEPFNVGGAMLQYPGDPLGPDDETINCRCVHVFSDTAAPVLRHSFEGGNLMDDQLAVAASGALDVLLASFDPAKHPRNPATGRDNKESPDDGGKFRSRVPTANQLNRVTLEEREKWMREGLTFYHNGPRAALHSIAEHGLLPGGGGVGAPHPGQDFEPEVQGVYGHEDGDWAREELAQVNEFSEAEEEMFDTYRVNVPPGNADPFARDEEDALVYTARIPPEWIEVQDERNRWVPVKQEAGQRVRLASGWDPAKHPHRPKGRGGGQWARAAEVAQQAAGSGVVMDVTETDEALKLNQIVSEEPGKGHASDALDSLVEYADSAGKPVYLNPASLGGLTQEQLVAWYRRHGFVPVGKGMVHEQAQILAAALSADELEVLQAAATPWLVRWPQTEAALDSLLASFDPSKHPRNPAGKNDGIESPSDGGKFKAEGGDERIDANQDGSTDDAWARENGAGVLEGKVLEDWQAGYAHDPDVRYAVTDVMEAAPGLKGEVTVYRGYGDEYGLNPGEDRLISTSLVKRVAAQYGGENFTAGDSVAEIRLPKGLLVAWNGLESEVILPPDVEFEQQDDGTWRASAPFWTKGPEGKHP